MKKIDWDKIPPAQDWQLEHWAEHCRRNIFLGEPLGVVPEMELPGIMLMLIKRCKNA